MACTVDALLESACESEIGKLSDPIQLLQVIAQLLADESSEDTSIEAILSRACESGIGKLSDPIQLKQVIAQLLCDSA